MSVSGRGLHIIGSGVCPPHSCEYDKDDDEVQFFTRARFVALTGTNAVGDVRAGSVLGLGPARRTFDLLLFDAPYDTGAGSVALDKLNRLGWIGADSLISIETSQKEIIDVAGFEIDTERKVGKAKLTLLRQA